MNACVVVRSRPIDSFASCDANTSRVTSGDAPRNAHALRQQRFARRDSACHGASRAHAIVRVVGLA
jgi:hypothetical protein